MSLPSDDTDLETVYSDLEVLDVATKDSVYVDQEATNQIAIHQFKNYVGASTKCVLRWSGKTDLSGSIRPIYLEIYNRISGVWDSIASNNDVSSGVDFELVGSITDLSPYIDGSKVISCRVYQNAVI